MDNPESHASRPSPSAERTVTQAEQEVMVELDAQVKNITDQNVTDQVKQNDLIRFGESLNLKAMEQIEELIDLENKTKNLPNKKKIMNEKKQETVVDLRK
jgi:cytochrome c